MPITNATMIHGMKLESIQVSCGSLRTKFCALGDAMKRIVMAAAAVTI